MEEIIQALIACSRPYMVECGHRRRVPGFYRAPTNPKKLHSFAADFSKEALIKSGLFTADAFEPVVQPGAPFVVLRDDSDRVIDVLFQGDSFTGRLPLLLMLNDQTFLASQEGGDSICLVETLADMALLRLAGIRVSLFAGCATATSEDLTEVIHNLTALSQRDGGLDDFVIIVPDWHIDLATYQTPVGLDEALEVCDHLGKLPESDGVWFQLWRPSQPQMASIQQARGHDLAWMIQLLRQSLAEDLRLPGERDRPFETGYALAAYLLRSMYRIALRCCGRVAGACDFITHAREYKQLMHAQLIGRLSASAVGDSMESSFEMEAALRRFVADLALPDFLAEVVAPTQIVSEGSSVSIGTVLESAPFAEFERAAESAAHSARAAHRQPTRRP